MTIPTKPTFSIDVCRTGYGFATIKVQAATQKEAEELALEEAGNHGFSEKTSEYTLVHGSAPADKPDLSAIDAEQLARELRRRGLVVSVWGHEDLDGICQDPVFEHLSDEQLSALEPALFQLVADGLEDRLSDRGNQHIDDAWQQRRADFLREHGIEQPSGLADGQAPRG